MGPAWLAIRSAIRRARRWRALGAVILVGSSVGLGLGSVLPAATASGTAALRGEAARTVAVTSEPGRVGEVPLTIGRLAHLRSLPWVERILPSSRASIGVKSSRVGGVLLSAVSVGSRRPPVMRSIRRRPLPLRPGEILVPARAQGQDLSSLLGRRITIDRIRRTGSATGRGATSTVRVVGLVDPGWQVDGPDPAYGSLEDVDRWAAAAEGLSTAAYRGERGYDRVDVVVRDLPVATARARLQRAGYTATSLDQLAGGLPAAVDAMRTASRWGMVLLLVLVVGCAAVVSLEEVGRREAEVGMLQALGWSPAMVARTLLVEVGAVAVASAAGSLLGGSVATWALHRAFDGAAWTHAGSSGIILPSLSLWLAMSVAIVVLALVGAGAGTWRAVRMDPATALSRAPDAG